MALIGTDSDEEEEAAEAAEEEEAMGVGVTFTAAPVLASDVAGMASAGRVDSVVVAAAGAGVGGVIPAAGCDDGISWMLVITDEREDRLSERACSSWRRLHSCPPSSGRCLSVLPARLGELKSAVALHRLSG